MDTERLLDIFGRLTGCLSFAAPPRRRLPQVVHVELRMQKPLANG